MSTSAARPPLVETRALSREYPVRGARGARLRALAGVDLTLHRGETLGIVGESGCGKSTLARLLVALDRPTSGSVLFDGEDVTTLRGDDLKRFRRRAQMVFQDPHASLNPRVTVGDTIEEVLRVHRLAGDAAGRRARVEELLRVVGLPEEMLGRYPHQMSGGQRQRVGIARALAVDPELLVLDEPVSALDVSVRAEIMNLLADLRDRLGLTYLFISHDLGMIRHLSDRVAVMYLGRVVESGDWQQVSDAPVHPYTVALQAAVPVADPAREQGREVSVARGEVPDPTDPPPGCDFEPRCPLAGPLCREEDPPLERGADGRWSACHAVHGRLATGEVRP